MCPPRRISTSIPKQHWPVSSDSWPRRGPFLQPMMTAARTRPPNLRSWAGPLEIQIKSGSLTRAAKNTELDTRTQSPWTGAQIPLVRIRTQSSDSSCISSPEMIVVQSPSHDRLFATSWTVACQASLSLTISRSPSNCKINSCLRQWLPGFAADQPPLSSEGEDLVDKTCYHAGSYKAWAVVLPWSSRTGSPSPNQALGLCVLINKTLLCFIYLFLEKDL